VKLKGYGLIRLCVKVTADGMEITLELKQQTAKTVCTFLQSLSLKPASCPL